MVSTRTQDGTICTKTYSPLTLDLNALSLQSPLPSPMRSTRSHGGPGSPTKVLKPSPPRKASRRGSRTPTSAKKQKFANLAASEANASVSTAPVPALPPTPRTRSAAKVAFAEPVQQDENAVQKEVDLLEGNTFFPSVAIGEKEMVGLSKIGRAEKEVKIWETVLAEHKEKMPSLVPVVEEKLDVNPAESAIKARLDVLDWALSTSQFGPEAYNIKCAIEGYRTGQIGYSDHYTVIYAAHIVDTVATYSEFVRNRTEMLDRYFELHGPGWMWYEPPLNVHPESVPKSFPSVALEREEQWTALGGWYVRQGFWKRAGWVSRMPQADWVLPGIGFEGFDKHPSDPRIVNCQDEGPRLSFRSLLDSGATFPSLHQEDFDSLGIDMASCGAQSVTPCYTAAGISINRLFELFVCVLDNDGKQLVDPNNAVYPLSHKYLGGLCPVSLSIVPITWDTEGRETNHRLSGISSRILVFILILILTSQTPTPLPKEKTSTLTALPTQLPFVASYVSSTPTRNTLFLGEDRNSVLGSHRMPGQKKWSIEIPRIVPGLPDDRFGEPKIRFVHRKGRLVDEDDDFKDHVSYLTVYNENGFELKKVANDPGTRQRELVETLERERREEEQRRLEEQENERMRRELMGGM
ncbi:hypothetical protein DL98DRAFT_652057 [Cadophora sp. DSE1049]|nr:hypothetical protein DL98DRAFT_652057 [Cadophora sp. DSE1049]